MIVYLIYVLAGLGAGLVTGLAGLSAAVVISPILISLLGFDAFSAIGISLSADVLASALSAVTYARHDNIDFKGGLWLLLPALVLTLTGCFLGHSVSNTCLTVISCVFPMALGLWFVIAREGLSITAVGKLPLWIRHIMSIASGAVIGLICGFTGSGGGMMMLTILTIVLCYNLKTAVGTSVFIMTFVSFLGAATHFAMSEEINWTAVIICAVSALLGAFFASLFANRVDSRLLHRVIGICLLVLSVFMTLFRFVF